jgi:hypothetical protein
MIFPASKSDARPDKDPIRTADPSPLRDTRSEQNARSRSRSGWRRLGSAGRRLWLSQFGVDMPDRIRPLDGRTTVEPFRRSGQYGDAGTPFGPVTLRRSAKITVWTESTTWGACTGSGGYR